MFLMKNKKILIMASLFSLLLASSIFAQDPRTGSIAGNNSTYLFTAGTRDDTSAIFYLSALYNDANFNFVRLPKSLIGGSTDDDDSVGVKFYLQGSQTGDFNSYRSWTIDSTAAITAVDTQFDATNSVLGEKDSSHIYDQFPSGTTEIPWHRNFPYIRFILDSRNGSNDTNAYRIDYVLGRKPK